MAGLPRTHFPAGEGLNRPRPVEVTRLVSYRSFKHLLGETSLERKCRFIFGGGILVLVSASFFWYGQKTESLVREQTTQTARMLVNPTLLNMHYKALGNNDFAPILDVLFGRLQAAGRPAQPRGPGSSTPQLHRRQEAAARTTSSARRSPGSSGRPPAHRKAGHSPEKQHTFADGTPTWAERITKDKKEITSPGIPVRPGRLLQAELPDGLPRRTMMAARRPASTTSTTI